MALRFLAFLLILHSSYLFSQMPGMGGGDFKNMKDPKIGRIFGKVLDNITKKTR